MIKKTLFISIALCLMITSLAACTDSTANNDKTESDNSQSQVDVTESITSNDEQQQPTNEQTTHSEYVKTYFVYAEQGAVVTWFDSKTGEFSYQDKCETCGKTANGTHSGGLKLGEGSSYTASYNCQNASCSQWGKPQRVIISCEVTGEWVEVTD